MRIVVHHEVRPESLNAILRDGIRCDDEGEKSDDVIRLTDDCLQSRQPADLAARGVSRSSVVYGYLSVDGKLVDIRTGDEVDAERFTAGREQVLLSITVESTDCFVSDLDAYDAVKMCVDSGAEETLLTRLADRYWARVVPFDDYEAGLYRRPEVMVVKDVAPEAITVVTPGG
ncbi:MAG TPA: hypothetical protein VHH12_00480 [Mycobacterium sp.]|nr:hypothetical protein [Mycobacterium sp.]